MVPLADRVVVPALLPRSAVAVVCAGEEARPVLTEHGRWALPVVVAGVGAHPARTVIAEAAVPRLALIGVVAEPTDPSTAVVGIEPTLSGIAPAAAVTGACGEEHEE